MADQCERMPPFKCAIEVLLSRMLALCELLCSLVIGLTLMSASGCDISLQLYTIITCHVPRVTNWWLLVWRFWFVL